MLLFICQLSTRWNVKSAWIDSTWWERAFWLIWILCQIEIFQSAKQVTIYMYDAVSPHFQGQWIAFFLRLKFRIHFSESIVLSWVSNWVLNNVYIPGSHSSIFPPFPILPSIMSFACTSCKEVFESKYKREKHQHSICTQVAEVIFANKTVQLKREKNGNFICYCSAQGCPKEFINIRTIQNHAKTKLSDWIGTQASQLVLKY